MSVTRTDWATTTTVQVVADRMTAWSVRQFVREMDEAGIDDREMVEAGRALDTQHFNRLTVRRTDTRPVALAAIEEAERG